MGADNSQWKNFVMFMMVAKMCPRWVGKMLKIEQVDRESTGENVIATLIMHADNKVMAWHELHMML